MTNLIYQNQIISSFSGIELSFLCTAIVHELMTTYSLNHFEIRNKLTENEPFEVSLLRYTCEKLTSFEILQTHPEYAQKAIKLDSQHIEQFGATKYETYLRQLTNKTTIEFKDEKIEFSKSFNSNLLNILYEALKKARKNNEKLLKAQNSIEATRFSECIKKEQAIFPELSSKIRKSISETS